MRRTFGFALLLVIAFCTPSVAHVAIRVTDDVGGAYFEPTLRSAYLLRDSGLDLIGPASFEESQRKLVRHFGVVLAILKANSGRSLELALDRLETRRGEQWSPDERARWRQALARQRLLNLLRLRSYQLRGRFPINDHVANRTVPIFVDRFDTACAVGHLMRESGWRAAVAEIQRTNNLVYVTDVKSGPLVEWIADSGLLQEEVALIQPGYEITTPPDASRPIALLSGENSLSARGLSYGRFDSHAFVPFIDDMWSSTLPPGRRAEILARVFADPTSSPAFPFDHASLFFGPASVNCFCFPENSFTPVYPRWARLGGLAAFGPLNAISSHEYSYQVAAINPGERINAVTLLSNFVVGNLNFTTAQDSILVAALEVTDALGQLLGRTALDGASDSLFGRLEGRKVVSFAPQQRVNVRMQVVGIGWPVEALANELSVVPEPASPGLVVVGLVATPLARRRRGRS